MLRQAMSLLTARQLMLEERAGRNILFALGLVGACWFTRCRLLDQTIYVGGPRVLVDYLHRNRGI